MDLNIYLFLLGLVITMFGTLVGVMAMRNGNMGLGLTALIIGPTVGPALMWTAI